MENQPPQIKRFFVIEDDSELSGTDIKNPEAATDQNSQPVVTMEFTDKGREAFARVTKRIAERGSQDHPAGRDAARADLPALRDHARQLDRLAGDDRLRLEPRGHRRPHRRSDREHRELPGDQRPGGEPPHRRAADRAQADLEHPGLGHARPAGARPGPDRGRRGPRAHDPLPAALLPRAGAGGHGGAPDLRGPAVRARQAHPDHADAAGHRRNGAHVGGGRRREHRHVRAHQGGGARRADRSRRPSPPATRRRCARSSTRTS